MAQLGTQVPGGAGRRRRQVGPANQEEAAEQIPSRLGQYGQVIGVGHGPGFHRVGAVNVSGSPNLATSVASLKATMREMRPPLSDSTSRPCAGKAPSGVRLYMASAGAPLARVRVSRH